MTVDEQRRSIGPDPISVIVLAGGMSRRMGTPKALLRLSDDGQVLIARVWQRAGEISDDIVIVGGELPDPPSSVRHIPDDFPGEGPLPGLLSGLRVIRYQRALLLGCDMPFVRRELVAAMARLDREADLVALARSSASGPAYEPFHAIYHRRIVPVIDGAIAAGERRLHAIGPEVVMALVPVDVRSVHDPGGWSGFSVNSPRDLEIARIHYQEESPPGGDDAAPRT